MPCPELDLRARGDYFASRGKLELPNCEDPVFKAWCLACGLRPGHVYSWHDARIQQLQELMADPQYDPEQDPLDDPFPEEEFPF